MPTDMLPFTMSTRVYTPKCTYVLYTYGNGKPLTMHRTLMAFVNKRYNMENHSYKKHLLPSFYYLDPERGATRRVAL